MDGYSVQEAASVLGVAEGRVWELLARGVLFGTPEGDSMRVFLKAQAGPIAAAAASPEPRTNGNGGSHGATGEASAFRELLTEFRNLTERYGQALLALGEARGEVAGLRSRIDQLEARLDLRLPPPRDAAPVAWESSTDAMLTPEPPRATGKPPQAPVRRTPRPRKAPSPREAVAGFAEALARAQDPSAADLREAPAEVEAVVEEAAPATGPSAPTLDEPVSAPAAARAGEAAAGEPTVEAAVPTEPPAQIEAPTYSAVVVEPDWFADGDFAWLDAAEMETSGQPEAMAAQPQPETEAPEPVTATIGLPEPEPEPLPEPEPEPQVRAEPQALAEPTALPEPQPEAEAPEPVTAAIGLPEPEPEPLPEPEPEPQVLAQPHRGPAAAPEPETEFAAAALFEPWQPPASTMAEVDVGPVVTAGPADTGASETSATRTAVTVEDVEEEVMWLGADPEPGPVARDEPPTEHRADAEEWPTVDVPGPTIEAVRPPLAMTEDELARLALDEGWDESEVAAIRAMITPLPSARVDLPGATELHEAMAALEAVPVRSDPAFDVSRQWAKAAPEDDAPVADADWAFQAEPGPPPAAAAAPRPPADVTSALRQAAADAGWLRRRPGPAAAAYRRLRRLFPG